MVAGQRRLRTYAATERSPRRVLAGPWSRPPGAFRPARRPGHAVRLQGLPRRHRRAVFQRARIRSFAFDVEVLFLARRLGARIKELPVDVTFRAGGTFDVRRHLLPFLGDIVAVRRHALAGDYGDLSAGFRRAPSEAR